MDYDCKNINRMMNLYAGAFGSDHRKQTIVQNSIDFECTLIID